MVALAEFLNQTNADRETVLQATRYWILEKSGDTPDREQRQILANRLSAREFERIKEVLSSQPDLLEAVCLLLLSQGWENPDDVASIQTAIAAAKEKLPVTDKLILAVIAMYGMYRLSTQGGFDWHQTTVQDPNGMYRQEQNVSHAPFAPIIDSFLKHMDHSSNQQGPSVDPMAPETLRRVQTLLQHDGLYRGQVDGKWGPLTHRAVLGFQQRSGLEATGNLDRATLSALHIGDSPC